MAWFAASGPKRATCCSTTSIPKLVILILSVVSWRMAPPAKVGSNSRPDVGPLAPKGLMTPSAMLPSSPATKLPAALQPQARPQLHRHQQLRDRAARRASPITEFSLRGEFRRHHRPGPGAGGEGSLYLRPGLGRRRPLQLRRVRGRVDFLQLADRHLRVNLRRVQPRVAGLDTTERIV